MDETTKKFDIVMIGVGHQSLICANYLAKAGFKICVLDTPSPMSGATPYAEFHEGIKTGPCAHVPVSLNSQVVDDLKLEEFGFSIGQSQSNIFAPHDESKFLFLNRDEAETIKNISQFSEPDAKKFFSLFDDLKLVSDLFSKINAEIPEYNQSGWKDVWAVFEAAKLLADEQDELQTLFAKLMTMSLSDFLNEYFESDALKGLIGYHVTQGSMINPAKPGSAVALVLHVMAMGASTLYTGDWQPIRGSLQPYFKALTQAALAQGVTFDTGATVQKIVIEGNKFKSVETDNGVYKAPVLIGDINPQIMFQDLIDAEQCPPDFAMKLNNFSGNSSFIRVKCALKELPKFTCLEGQSEETSFLNGDITLAPNLNYIQKAHDESLSEGGSQRPGVSVVLPSLVDQDFEKDGLYACSLLGQYFEPSLPDTQENQIAVAKAVIESVTEFAPNFRDSVVTFLPIMGEALDKTIGPLNMDLTGGSMSVRKLFQRRFSHHALMDDIPFDGIYICGYGPESSANPHVMNTGFTLAQYISDIRKPSAVA